MSEQSYIIRIYRKEKLVSSRRGNSGRRRHDHTAITGVIETVEHGKRSAFHDIEELWAVLAEAETEN